MNDLNTRFVTLRAWMIDRGAKNYISVFRAVSEISQKEADLVAYWWGGRERLEEKDAPLLAKLEGIVEHIKAYGL